jgi:phosphocarrier protein HPr
LLVSHDGISIAPFSRLALRQNRLRHGVRSTVTQGPISRTVRIGNRRGLHARASAKFVNLASQLDATIEVEKDGNKVCGTSIMGLMMLGAAMDDSVTLHVSGIGAESALAQLTQLIEERFGED